MTTSRSFVLAAAALFLPAVVCAQPRGPGSQGRNAAHQAQQDDAVARRQRVGWIPPQAGVQRDGSHWVGPAYGENEIELFLDRPWQRGRFKRGVGPGYVWQLQGGTRERFSLGGGWFSLAPADYDRGSEWRWTNDAIVIYPDTAHEGWYRAYSVRLQTYIHVRYLGD